MGSFLTVVAANLVGNRSGDKKKVAYAR